MSLANPISGRQVTVTRSGTGPGFAVLRGIMSKTFTMKNGEIDITNDDDSGWQSFLDQHSVRGIDGSIEGVLKDTEYLALQMVGPVNGSYVIDFPGFGEFTGTFFFGDLELTMESGDAVKYSLPFKSSGVIVYTPDTTV